MTRTDKPTFTHMLAMPALALGILLGALWTTGPSKAAPPSVDLAVAGNLDRPAPGAVPLIKANGFKKFGHGGFKKFGHGGFKKFGHRGVKKFGHGGSRKFGHGFHGKKFGHGGFKTFGHGFRGKKFSHGGFKRFGHGFRGKKFGHGGFKKFKGRGFRRYH